MSREVKARETDFKNGSSDSFAMETRREALLKEYEFVEGLIPLYRQFQMQLVRYGFLVYTAVLTLYAANLRLTASVDNNESEILANLLPATIAILPVAIAFLLFAFATTEARIKRASTHITFIIAPQMNKLAKDELFQWERSPGSQLTKLERLVSTSTPLIITLGAPALIAALWYIFYSKHQPIPSLIAILNTVLLIGGGSLALSISLRHETRSKNSDEAIRGCP